MENLLVKTGVLAVCLILLLSVYWWLRPKTILIKSGDQFREEVAKLGDKEGHFIIKTGILIKDGESMTIPPNLTVDCTHPDCTFSGEGTLEFSGAVKSR